MKKILPQKIKLLTVVLLLIANPWFWDFCQGFRFGFDFDNFETIFRVTPVDIQQINIRRSYYSNQLLGKIFENKLVFYVDRYEKNFFQGLDLNYYFFANHPRERVGVTEKEKYLWYWLPIFLIGFFWSLKNSFFIHNLISLEILLIISFLANIDNFVLFVLPFLTFNIYLGLKRIILK